MMPDRRDLRWRKRRIVFNDDTDTRDKRHPGSKSKEAFLAARFERTLETHVGSYSWCVGNGMEEPFSCPEPPAGDPEALILQAARERDMEIFASLRMNDSHESLKSMYGGLITPLKKEHPELCIGEPREYPGKNPHYRSAYCFWWGAFDYSHEEVRQYFLRFIGKILRKYDWDGFEMDFCRHPIFFKPGRADEGIGIMTQFVADVRDILDRVGEERGRPVLLAAHVNDSPELALQLGLDVEEWLKRGDLDILIAGLGTSPSTAAYAEFVGLGHDHDVPVYPCISGSIFSAGNTAGHAFAELMRACAANIWADEPDGIYLFNLFVLSDARIWAPQGDPFTFLPEDKVWGLLNELGDPRVLADLEKIYTVQQTRTSPHMLVAGAPFYLPQRLVENWRVPLRVEEDLAGRQARLRVRVTSIAEEEGIVPRVNGNPVTVESTQAASERRPGPLGEGGGTWFEGTISSPPLRKGVNLITIIPGVGCLGSRDTLVQDIELHVGGRDAIAHKS